MAVIFLFISFCVLKQWLKNRKEEAKEKDNGKVHINKDKNNDLNKDKNMNVIVDEKHIIVNSKKSNDEIIDVNDI